MNDLTFIALMMFSSILKNSKAALEYWMRGRASHFPLERLIRIRGRVSYRLSVRDASGDENHLICAFQTQNDFIFTAMRDQFALGENVSVRVNTLKGARWYRCAVSFIEEHSDYSLYQMTIET